MIERQNYHDVKAFIRYQSEVEQKDPLTIRGFEVYLKHLLLWADNIPLPQAPRKEKPTLPNYLLTVRNDTRWQAAKIGKPLAFATQQKICGQVRMFYTWAKAEYPNRYKDVKQLWIESIQPSRKAARDGAQLKTIEAWTLEDALKIANIPDEKLQIERLDGMDLEELAKPGKHGRLNLALLRAQASICFLYLTGMRITAFLSLPVSCVDLERLTVRQDPSMGVLTKFRKAAITGFLPIPELMEPVKKWDAIVRENAPTTRRWCASLNTWGTAIIDDGLLLPAKAAAKRVPFVDTMKTVCNIAGVAYKSPHKLRHGHAVYGVKNAKDIAELKAVSQNLMHSSINITDGVYGNLSAENAREILSGLTGNHHPTPQAVPVDFQGLLSDPRFLEAFGRALLDLQKQGK
ncbi:MAG: site-specific integrase [Anaerolineaceae bacterium]|nr:site-specific integrase [Anaerolineaceae bacterium]